MQTAVMIPVEKILINEGQIKDVPSNPRFIKTDRYEKLKQSIKDEPEFLELRELIIYPRENDYICLCGNMRLRACIDLGYKECPCKIVPADTPAKKLRAYVIKDNIPYGENDTELIANEWDIIELETWGMESWQMGGATAKTTRLDIEPVEMAHLLISCKINDVKSLIEIEKIANKNKALEIEKSYN